MVGVLTKESRSKTNQIVKSTGSLQRSCSRNDTHNDKHHVERDVTWFQSEKEDENEHADHTVDTKSYSSHASSDKDKRQYDE